MAMGILQEERESLQGEYFMKKEREDSWRWVPQNKKNRRDLWQQISQKNGMKSFLGKALGNESFTTHGSKQRDGQNYKQPSSQASGSKETQKKALHRAGTQVQSKVNLLARPVDYFILQALLVRHPTKTLH